MSHKRQLTTPKIKTKAPWIFWQRKAQTHVSINLINNYEKWGGIWDNEIEILEDGIRCFRFALSYKDRGYHKVHRKYRDEAKALIKKLINH